MNDDLPPWHLDTVRADAMIEWVALLRDANPIHVDPAAAEALGFEHRTVNPGPTNLAYAINMLMEAVPGSYPREILARFGANIYADDAIVVTGHADRDSPTRYHATVQVPARNVVSVEVSATLSAWDDPA
jgi:acyl dehydratase